MLTMTIHFSFYAEFISCSLAYQIAYHHDFIEIKFPRRQNIKMKINLGCLPSRVLFLAIKAKSISEFGSFPSEDEDEDEFCM